jgi:two-component system cell cycle response regulator
MADERHSTIKFPVVSEVSVSEAPPGEDEPDAEREAYVPPQPTYTSQAPPVAVTTSHAPSAISSFPRQPSYIDSEWIDSDTSVTRPTETSIELPPAVSTRDRALLTVLSGLNAGQVFTIDTAETIIGRGRDVAVRIEDVGISRAHSRIVRTMDGKFVIEDLRSTNGTFVGGRRVERSEIHANDRLQIGPNVVLRFGLIDEAEEQLAHQLYEASTKDALTRAYNRKYFVERLSAEVAYAHRHATHLSLVLFDLDHFKTVNDTYGHLAGDVVLRVVSAQVLRTIRTEDVLSRYGGEEFVILIRGIEHKNAAFFGERVRKAVERLAVPWENQILKATISCGVASLSECGENANGEQVLHLADERLYAAKSGGRNCIVST